MSHAAAVCNSSASLLRFGASQPTSSRAQDICERLHPAADKAAKSAFKVTAFADVRSRRTNAAGGAPCRPLPTKSDNGTLASADIFMHVWQLQTSANGVRQEAAKEVELIASHTSDLSQLDPSCPACCHLRSRLQVIAETVAQRVAASAAGVTFDVYAESARIVCSTRDGQRPCVTVSIYVRNTVDGSGPNGPAIAASRIKKALDMLGVRERQLSGTSPRQTRPSLPGLERQPLLSATARLQAIDRSGAGSACKGHNNALCR